MAFKPSFFKICELPTKSKVRMPNLWALWRMRGCLGAGAVVRVMGQGRALEKLGAME